MEIYLDVIWLLNFCFDLLLLSLTGKILKRNVKKFRLVLGALIGSGIVLIMFTPFSWFVSHPAGKLAFSLLIVFAAFGFKRFRYFLQNWLTFFFVTFLLGGGIIGAHSLLQSDGQLENGALMTASSGFGDPISWIFVIIGFPILWIFSKKRIEDIEIRKIQFEEHVNVQVMIGGQKVFLKGLVDSGNQLYDPLTKTPVMIVYAECLKPIVGEAFLELVKTGDSVHALEQIDETFPFIDRLRLVPYRGVGQQNQFLLSIKPDDVLVYTKEEIISVEKCFVGISPSGLSSDDDFQAIVHPKMLSEKGIKHVS
ncbi:sigma-E processing peptidase SpoIIGA [Bacillus gobiensis]|uniref:sigma-E processing peptidase SpoIIGA n=1 Tax=Bacillus gobiensis TaxID=1441095 RepID=UPI003D1CA6D9